jgi:hypothetical protein
MTIVGSVQELIDCGGRQLELPRRINTFGKFTVVLTLAVFDQGDSAQSAFIISASSCSITLFPTYYSTSTSQQQSSI